jgi:carnitine 3-dehydrogenase
LIGPHLTFDLAGSVGGIDHFLTLGNPTLSPELQERLTAGIAAETTGRGIAELEAWRDHFLVDLLALKTGRN